MVRFGKANGILPAVRSVLKAGVSSEKLCEEQAIPFSRFRGRREAAHFKCLALQ